MGGCTQHDVMPQSWSHTHVRVLLFINASNGVFTLAWSGTGTRTGTGSSIIQNLSHCTGTWKNGLYGFNKNLSHCTWTGTGKNISIHHMADFQDLKNGYQTHSSGPENVPGVLPCPCSGAVWKVLIKTIQPILPGPCPCPGPGPSQCEYTIMVHSHLQFIRRELLREHFSPHNPEKWVHNPLSMQKLTQQQVWIDPLSTVQPII